MSQRKAESVLKSFVLVAVAMINACAPNQRGGDKATVRPNGDVERLAFEEALKQDSAAAYENFLGDHPNSELAAEARSRLAGIETRDWEYACAADTLDAYIRFHRSHRKARPDELRDRLQRLVGASGIVAGGDLTEHSSYLKTANIVEWHNLTILYGESSRVVGGSIRPPALVGLLGAPGSRATCTGGVSLSYPEDGTISTTGPLASMVFDDDLTPTVDTHAQVTYVLMPASGSTLVFNADSGGLHHVSGSGTVLAAAKDTVVHAYK